jgi:hypothetical protein
MLKTHQFYSRTMPRLVQEILNGSDARIVPVLGVLKSEFKDGGQYTCQWRIALGSGIHMRVLHSAHSMQI